jgi:hypothetical protein
MTRFAGLDLNAAPGQRRRAVDSMTAVKVRPGRVSAGIERAVLRSPSAAVAVRDHYLPAFGT